MESTTATRDPHPTWSEPAHDMRSRLHLRFAVTSWAMSALLTVALTTVGLLAMSLLAGSAFGETSTELGVFTIVAAMSTFVAFVLVQSIRLEQLDDDRLLNSMLVAVMHVAVLAALFGLELLVRGTTGFELSGAFTGPWTDEVGNAFTAVERSSVTTIVACALAAGVIPARGDRPRGTQDEAVDTDHQL